MKKVIAFIKTHRFDIIVTLSALAFIVDLFSGSHTFSITTIGLYVLAYFTDRKKNQHNIAERKKLRSKFLTPGDLRNISFVKDWEETRKQEMIKYSVVYGGIFFGFALCAVYSIGAMAIIQDPSLSISASPANLVHLIGYTYIAGFISGTILYRLLWTYKEQKFIRLTDPLH